MIKWLITFPGPKEGPFDHFNSQRRCITLLQEVGITKYKWRNGSALNSHTWAVYANPEELSALVLKADVIVDCNLTEKYRMSGLAKLNADEKEALGLQDNSQC